MTTSPRSGSSLFRVDPVLVETVLAAVAFLYGDDLPEHVFRQLNDPSPRTMESLNRLVELRLNGSLP